MTKIIEYFVRNHLISNLVMVLVIAGGIYAWFDIRKEELPDFNFDTVYIKTAYPGASPREVEQAITLPIEHELADLEGIGRIESKSRRGSSDIILELDRNINSELAVIEIRNRILGVDLPVEVEELPRVRQFKTSQKAVIDVALYFKDKPMLSIDERRNLQKHMRDIENLLLRRNEINTIERDAYLEEEIHIKPRIKDLFGYQLTLKELREGILSHHTDLPLGLMQTPAQEQVRLEGRLENPIDFNSVPLRSSFIGHSIKIADVADTVWAFEDSNTLVRINGHEGVVFNVVKSSQTGILEAVDIVRQDIDDFMAAHENSGLVIKLLDDESFGVRNRLSIISGNALIGFALIIIILSIFLNPRAALWVTLGIPFSFFFTLIMGNLLDYTVNNLTLAGVIIAMGMLVDDAIVVSENISRLRIEGYGLVEASIVGTRQVIAPILASILTTIAAFLPLLAFEGKLALLATTIPPIIALILTGSLIESILILPGHLSLNWKISSFLIKSIPGLKMTKKENKAVHNESTWFENIEKFYARKLEKILYKPMWIVAAFLIFTTSGIIIFLNFMNFSLFPGEKVSTMFVIAEAPVQTRRLQTLELAKPVEKFFMPNLDKQFLGIRTLVGYRRYRPSDEENVVSVRVELDEENLTGLQTNKIVKDTNQFIKSIKGFEKLRLSTQMFGSDTGSAIEILVLENNDKKRHTIADELSSDLGKLNEVGYVEIDQPASEYEYKITPRRAIMDRLDIDPAEVEATLRSTLSGVLLYSFYDENEKKDVRLRFDEQVRMNINNVLSIPAANRGGFQVTLKNILKAERIKSISEIQRINQRRVLRVNADIKPESHITALEMAKQIEKNIFAKLKKKHPSSDFIFDGEIKNTRESSSFFQTAIVLVLILIYSILAIQFNSVYRPLIIMITIIPAWVSVVYVFLLHGINIYGFFAAVGALGLSGIVVNGAILLLDRIDRGYKKSKNKTELVQQIARLSSTRLRAVFLTTITTVAGLLPTAYGIAGYDSMLSEMMLTISWGLVFAMSITLILIPAITCIEYQWKTGLK